ncbi:DUF357 domain-containing protein [uncultured Methanofollis sp.]|uniref:DUF357 domain-containing protein n=1 Tax=uncultured Methanofollis sp. TaxID=262500 RepID=UPI0026046643|nr:DUF357 domain-containing protein [uncultured Methanofollis sp.]
MISSDQALEAALGAVVPTVPKGSALAQVSACVLRMAESYLSDGRVFAGRGDLVNAHASFAYAFGWLDTGAYLGLYDGRVVPPSYDFEASIPPSLAGHLQEKTARYERLLSQALLSIEPAPDAETPMFSAACRLRDVGRTALEEGQGHATAGRLDMALGWYSYGYGWLDAGVQAGLFIITGSREIFTV